MPGVASWNGKWSGERDYYAIIKSFRGKSDIADAERILRKGYYHYAFGDGWRAAVYVRRVDSAEAREVRKKSNGFCGYDWMIDSIISTDEIKPPDVKIEE
jgi:hypothetical protein